MKSRIVLLTATLFLLITAGICPAFTLAEHEANVKKYVQAMAKSPEITKTYCEMDGTVLTDVATMGQYDSVRYMQGVSDASIELRPVGEIISFTTKNPEFQLPDGSKVGDPIDRVMKAALIPGDYSRQIGDSVIVHIWMRDWKATMVGEVNAAISFITFTNLSKTKSVTINDDYRNFLDETGQSAASAPESKKTADAAPAPVSPDTDRLFFEALILWEDFENSDKKNIMYCDRQGNPKNNGDVEYHQDSENISIWALGADKSPSSAYFATKGEFPCGIKCGDLMSEVLRSGKVSNKYTVQETNGMTIYSWHCDNYLMNLYERDGRFVCLDVFDPDFHKQVPVLNQQYEAFIGAPAARRNEQTAPSAPSGAALTSPKDWAKTLSKTDYNKAVKIYEMLTTFGANEAEVTKKLGNPTNKYILEMADDVTVYYGYGGKKDPTGQDSRFLDNADLRLTFISDNKASKISTINCVSAKYKFKHVNVGDSFDKAVKVFGKDHFNNDGRVGASFTYRVDLSEWLIGGEVVSITFEVENKKIKGIFAEQYIDYGDDDYGDDD